MKTIIAGISTLITFIIAYTVSPVVKRFSVTQGKTGIFEVHDETNKLVAVIKDGVPYKADGVSALGVKADDHDFLWSALVKTKIVTSEPFVLAYGEIDITPKNLGLVFEQDGNAVSIGAVLSELELDKESADMSKTPTIAHRDHSKSNAAGVGAGGVSTATA